MTTAVEGASIPLPFCELVLSLLFTTGGNFGCDLRETIRANKDSINFRQPITLRALSFEGESMESALFDHVCMPLLRL